MVIEQATGKILTGPQAPLAKHLKHFLIQHPTFQVVQPSNNDAEQKSKLGTARGGVP